MKPRNQETKKPRNQETKKPRDQAIKISRNQGTQKLFRFNLRGSSPPSTYRRPPLHQPPSWGARGNLEGTSGRVGSRLVHKLWHAERDARNETGLCFSVAKVQAIALVGHVASVRFSDQTPHHMKDSEHSCTAMAQLRKVALCILCVG